MKIETFGDSEPQEQPLRLKLFTEHDGVNLYAVDEKGGQRTCGRILAIDERGITRAIQVNHDLGLPLDSEGRVRLRDRYIGELGEQLARLRNVVESKKNCWPGDFIVLSNGAINVRLSDLQAILKFFE